MSLSTKNYKNHRHTTKYCDVGNLGLVLEPETPNGPPYSSGSPNLVTNKSKCYLFTN